MTDTNDIPLPDKAKLAEAPARHQAQLQPRFYTPGWYWARVKSQEPTKESNWHIVMLSPTGTWWNSGAQLVPEAWEIGAHIPAPDESGHTGWVCKAREQGSAGGHLPADCDWPVCGCDPQAIKVITAIEESGFVIIRAPGPEPARQARDKAIRIADACAGLISQSLIDAVAAAITEAVQEANVRRLVAE